LFTDNEGRTVFHLAANSSKQKWSGDYLIWLKRIKHQNCYKMLLATDNEGAAFRMAATLYEIGVL